MKPVKTADSNVVYKGPRPDIGDLWCQRLRPGRIRTTWEPDEEELRMLAEGGRVQITIAHEPIPPLMVTVASKVTTEPTGEHGWKIDFEPGDRLVREEPNQEHEQDLGDVEVEDAEVGAEVEEPTDEAA